MFLLNPLFCFPTGRLKTGGLKDTALWLNVPQDSSISWVTCFFFKQWHLQVGGLQPVMYMVPAVKHSEDMEFKRFVSQPELPLTPCVHHMWLFGGYSEGRGGGTPNVTRPEIKNVQKNGMAIKNYVLNLKNGEHEMIWTVKYLKIEKRFWKQLVLST